MPLPIALTVAYLAVNLPLMYWLERERARGRMPAPRVAALSSLLRYGPPLAGAAYLVTISGDWPFVLFVIAFFAGAFWLLDGLLNYPERPPKRER
jgi:hypothetical protein